MQYVIVNFGSTCTFVNLRYICRKIDGSCNNKSKPKYGQLLTPMQRILPNDYEDGTITPKRFNQNGQSLPSARLITQSIVSTAARTSRLELNWSEKNTFKHTVTLLQK